MKKTTTFGCKIKKFIAPFSFDLNKGFVGYFSLKNSSFYRCFCNTKNLSNNLITCAKKSQKL
jgi:hypothetical protein